MFFTKKRCLRPRRASVWRGPEGTRGEQLFLLFGGDKLLSLSRVFCKESFSWGEFVSFGFWCQIWHEKVLRKYLSNSFYLTNIDLLCVKNVQLSLYIYIEREKDRFYNCLISEGLNAQTIAKVSLQPYRLAMIQQGPHWCGQFPSCASVCLCG